MPRSCGEQVGQFVVKGATEGTGIWNIELVSQFLKHIVFFNNQNNEIQPSLQVNMSSQQFPVSFIIAAYRGLRFLGHWEI